MHSNLTSIPISISFWSRSRSRFRFPFERSTSISISISFWSRLRFRLRSLFSTSISTSISVFTSDFGFKYRSRFQSKSTSKSLSRTSGPNFVVSRTVVSSQTIIKRKKVSCSLVFVLVNPSEIHNCYNYNCSYYDIIQTKSSLKDFTETCIIVFIFMYQNITTNTTETTWFVLNPFSWFTSSRQKTIR